MKLKLLMFFCCLLLATHAMASVIEISDTTTTENDSRGIWKTDSLKEVVVTGSSINQHGNETKVFITKDLRRGAVNTSQLLGKLPNFYYNFADRTLTYHNSSNIAILVDSVEKDMNYLQNIQHIRFDRIEIIDKPQGKYQGYDVLINLHVKEHYEGYEGMVNTNEAFSLNNANSKHFMFENTGASFSYTKEKWNIYAYAFSYFGQGGTDYWWSKQYLQNGIKEEVLSNADGKKNWISFERIQTGQLSADYTINKNQSLSIVYQYNAGRDYDNYNHYSILRTNANTNSEELVERDTHTHGRNSEHSVALFYRNDQGKIKWNTDFNYRFIPSKYRSDQQESGGFQLFNHFKDQMDFTRFRLSGWTNFANAHATLSAGYENTWKSYKRKEEENDQLLNSNSYFRNRLWASVSYRFDNNAQLMLSGWAEHVRLKSAEETKNQVPVGGSFMAYYQLSRKNWMRLNYDCSTEYPDRGMSSEYGYFTDSLTWSGGNPWLKTNLTHRINYWIDLWWCFNFQTGYVYSPNTFNTIEEVREGTLANGMPGKYVASTYQNTDYKEWWASISVTKRFCRNFVYKADLKYRNARASYQSFSNHAEAWEGSTSLLYYYARWNMNLSAAYSYSRSLGITPQSTTKANYEEPSINVQKFLCKNRLELGLSYSLMFHLFNADVTSQTKSPGLISATTDKYFDRQCNRIMLYVAYRFSGGKSVRQYNREMATEK